MIVHPGDIVIGDADGVVAFAPAIAADLLMETRHHAEKEETILRSIADGTYANAYT
jgi:regulator of RNase E activity RraA